MIKRNIVKLFCVSYCILILAALPGFSADVETNHRGGLYQIYETIHSKLDNTPFGVPIFIETFFPDHKIRCHVYGVINQSYGNLSSVMRDPMNWCEMLLQHTNIKACTVQASLAGQDILTIYCGRKYYQPPEDTYHLALEFNVVDDERDYFRVRLSGEKGPLFTRNYLVEVDGISLTANKTFIRLTYEYDTGKTIENALKLYYATLGRKKVGFTVVGTDNKGEPVYVAGNQGLIERNSVRFYFSIQSFMETLDAGEGVRFDKRIHRWYDLISQCPRQLYELPEKEYIENKQKEKRNQIRLQKELQPNLMP